MARPFNSQDMLDNMAGASQSGALLEPTTRGAVLRCVRQWLSSYPDNITKRQLMDDLNQDPQVNA
jgi:hypothetical protein